MKKITYSLIILLFSVFINQPANANMEVVIGTMGPQVITNTSPSASFGPTVGGHNGGTVGVTGGSFAIVNSNGDVTNIVVCHDYCSNGTFGPGGDTAAMQIPNSTAGIWFGPNTTRYDRETKTFTVTSPTTELFTSTNEESSVMVFGKKTYTFVSGNLFFDNGNLNGITESWTENSSANVSVTKENNTESLFIENRKTNEEFTQLITDSNLILLNSKVQTLISLLENWIK